MDTEQVGKALCSPTRIVQKKKARMTGWVGRIRIWYLFWSILEYDNIFVLCRITDLSLFKKSVRIKEN